MSSLQQSSANAARPGLPTSFEVVVVGSGSREALTREFTADEISYLKWLKTNLIYFIIILSTSPIFLIDWQHGITLNIFLGLTMCLILSTLLGLALILAFSRKIQRINNSWVRFSVQHWLLIFPVAIVFNLICGIFMACMGETIRVVAAPPTPT
jgi:hypothetical protein